MEVLLENAIQKFQNRGMRPSIQRAKILQYLLDKRNHPTVDLIYQELLPELPTLSRTTVYNTLDAFCENGLAIHLDFGEGFLRYDADISPHSHFFCKCCQKVFDLEIPPEDIAPKLPKGFAIQESQLYAFGVCEECNKAKL